jgi:hypothetical protein
MVAAMYKIRTKIYFTNQIADCKMIYLRKVTGDIQKKKREILKFIQENQEFGNCKK